LKNLLSVSWWRNSPNFMEPCSSLPCPWQPTTSPYRESGESNLRSSMLLEIRFYIQLIWVFFTFILFWNERFLENILWVVSYLEL